MVLARRAPAVPARPPAPFGDPQRGPPPAPGLCPAIGKIWLFYHGLPSHRDVLFGGRELPAALPVGRGQGMRPPAGLGARLVAERPAGAVPWDRQPPGCERGWQGWGRGCGKHEATLSPALGWQGLRPPGGRFGRGDPRGGGARRGGEPGLTQPRPGAPAGAAGSGPGAHCGLSAQSLMAGSCEISNILSKYNSTMYQQEEPQLALDVLGHPGDDGSLGLSFPPSLPPVDTTGRMGRSGGGMFGGSPHGGEK